MKAQDPVPRFYAKVNMNGPGGCWIWTGAPTSWGYAVFSVNDRKTFVHRWSYEHFVGPIPEGRVLDHLCRVRNCVNPEHLEAVTQTVNLHRGIAVNKVHCANGHLMDEANTRLYPIREGRYIARECRACRRANAERRREVRRLMPRKPSRRILAPHGTHSAYIRHRSHGEQPCMACREGEREYQRQYRKLHPRKSRAAA